MWNKLQARFTAFICGYAYFNPTHPKEASDAFYALRDIGNSAQVIALAGMSEQRILDAIVSVIDATDTENHYTGGPIDLYGAYWYLTKDLKERGM